MTQSAHQVFVIVEKNKMSITATCGHTLLKHEGLGVPCSIKAYGKESDAEVHYVTYCFDCYRKAIIEYRVLLSEESESEWLFKEKK